MEIYTSEALALVFCFFASGFFSGSEAALMSIGIDRAQQLIEEGGAKAKAMNFMIDRPTELLTTILVGNNIVNILASSITTVIFTRAFDSDAIGIAVFVTTFFILIFGEIIPKTFARSKAESLSVFIITVLKFNFYALWPIIQGTVWAIEKLLGENAELTGRLVTKNDIEYLVSKAEKENSIDSKQIDLLNSILEFPTIKVKDIMIPRNRVKHVQASMGYEEILKEVEEDAHSRYPVCDGELDNMIGFLHIKDLAFAQIKKEKFQLEKFLKAPFFVYEHMKIQAVFDHMNRKKVHLAMVKDENGLVVGIITLEDIIEEILGEIQDEHDTEEDGPLNPNDDADLSRGITVMGSLSIRDLYNEYDIKIPLNDNYSTVAGFILDMLGNSFPEQGQIIVWENFRFELVKVDDYTIHEVFVKGTDSGTHIFSRKEATSITESSEGSEAHLVTK